MSLVLSAQKNDCIYDPCFIEECFGASERVRVFGIKNERRRQESIAGLFALKNALGGRVSAIIQRDERGRPYFCGSVGMDFSISHSGAFSVAALVDSSHGRVGVDIELADEKKEDTHRRIANRYFSEDEQRMLERSRTPFEFYKIWTAKEARAKLTGVGLAQRLSIDKAQTADENEKYYFQHFLLTYQSEKYVLTVCTDKNEEINFDCSDNMMITALIS